MAPSLSSWHHRYHHGTIVITMAPSLSSWHHRYHHGTIVIIMAPPLSPWHHRYHHGTIVIIMAPPLSPWHHCYHHGTIVIIMAPPFSLWQHVITKKSLDQFLPKLAKYLFVVLFQKCVEQPQRLSKVVIVIKNSNHLLKISIKTTICIWMS